MSIDHRITGTGTPLLLLHGAAEDADLVQPQADALAQRGFQVISYDRRGTGRSSRDGWPGGGVAAHVADAATLIREVAGGPAAVLGLSSGGVLALALAAAHPDLVTEVVAWEPPALMILPDGAELHAQLMAPIESYLDAHPQDWDGGYDVMTAVLSGGTADPSDPRVERMRRNAEPALRDDGPVITAHRLSPAAGDTSVVIAVGAGVDPLLDRIGTALAAGYGTAVRVVDAAGEHEIDLSDPDVLAAALASGPARRALT